MSAKQSLLNEFKKMESEREAVVNAMKNYNTSQLEKKPAANEWSVAEVIMHLVVAESGALAYMRKKLEFGGHQKATAGAGFKQKLLNLAIALPIKFKAPKVADIQEGQKVTFDEAAAKWADVRKKLLAEYDKMDDDLVTHELFKHPAAGKLSALQSVKFMRQHMNRHIKQMHNTIKKVS